MKARFTALDVLAVTSNVQPLVGLRVANIYDLNSKTYILKLSQPDVKKYLILEAGVRVHSTAFSREKSNIPSVFTMKLRKKIRTRRLEGVKQLGIDRVIDFQFGVGEFEHHLLLELYSQGNLILTDSKYVIIALLRTHAFDENVQTATGQCYPFTQAANIGFQSQQIDIKQQLQEFQESGRFKQSPTMKQILAAICPYMHFPLADHCLKELKYNEVNKKLNLQDLINNQNLINLLAQASEFSNTIIQLASKGKGYQIIKNGQVTEFTPVLLNCHQNMETKEFATLDQAVDNFYTSQESVKVEEKIEQNQSEAWKKYNRIKQDQEKRIEQLHDQSVKNEYKAELIIKNLDSVDQVILILKQCLSTGVSWTELWRMIKEEQRNGNPYANIIHKLKFETNQAVLLLEDEEKGEMVTVDIFVHQNAHLNAQSYYTMKKKASQKETKTIEAAEQALKQAGKKAKQQEAKEESQKGIIKIRKPYWWEKFYWFISSENFIVVSGHDAQQNEILVKRYMKNYDLYVHADTKGASSTIIINPGKKLIPRRTVEEAGIACVCRSHAWDQKVLTSAWWVYPSQVSKSAPTGEYLPTGSFMIRGKKNYMLPSRLEMGVTLIFRLHEDSLMKHLEERNEQLQQELENEYQKYSIDPSIPFSQQENQEISLINTDDPKPQKQQQQKNKQKQQEQAKEKQTQEEKDKKDNSKQKKDQGKKKNQQQQQQQKPEPQQQLTKSQIKKLKKMQEKYGEQDEEERKIRMQLIGTKPLKAEIIQQKQSEKTSAENEKENNQSSKEEKLEENAEKNSSNESENQEKEENQQEEEKIENTNEQNSQQNIEQEQEKNQNEQKTQEKSEDQEVQQLLKEEKILTEEELIQLSEVDKFTQTPFKDDQLLHAVTMCAPYSSLKETQYKIKLVPGNQKRGKISKEIVQIWRNVGREEQNVVKVVPEQEIISNIISNCRIQPSGGEKGKK